MENSPESDGPAQRGVLLDSLPEENRADLLELARSVSFDRGQTILTAGEDGDTMVLIETGRVEVSVTSHEGRRSILTQMGPGEVLGDLAVLDGGPRSADAVAAGPVTGRLLTRGQVMGYLERNPTLAIGLIRELCRKLRDASEIHAQQALTDGAQRLALVLVRLFDKWGTPDADGTLVMREFVSQAEIGDFAGLARENVNRQIRLWSREGILASKGRRLSLTDSERLREIAGI
ncbi:Crp/Fnr family transcriptional regulator [Roseisalinus antarcticus]|uniref:cAMP receptor protein n=1 Tax=Roseisalinus antarcticus TaxID=254357 RepID=A0A1Y5RAJ8_9RHOB|nr:Crp/Fnr family transcriptional regulator [Roseisalinus antarcticus]SLN12872.1 cAMP receptor protein [Roseisalinus antarcticus]